MTKELPVDSRELICINVDKVYDWIVKEKAFDISPSGPFTFPGLMMDTGSPSIFRNAVVTCKVTPALVNPVIIMNREKRPFNIDGETVYLQHLHLRKTFSVVLVLCLENGNEYQSLPVEYSRCEQVTLCAPTGTEIEVKYTSLECFVCSTGEIVQDQMDPTVVTFDDLTISVVSCQSIQSTFPVTVEFLAEYCNPRADLPTACPTPVRPSQCSNFFPTSDNFGC